MKTVQLFSLENTLAAELLEKYEYPWLALGEIKNFILELGPTLDKNVYEQIDENVWAAKSAKIFASAFIGWTLHNR